MKFTGYCRYRTRTNLECLGDVSFNALETGFFLSRSAFVSNVTEGEWIFVKFAGYIEHDTRNSSLDCFTSD